MPSLLHRVETWIEQDPDAETRAELTELLNRAREHDAQAHTELQERFSGELKFGTAGLRAQLGAGPTRMNRVVVMHTSAGFANFLLRRSQAGEASNPPSVVIGFDGRKNSEVFARDAAEIFAGAGLRAILLPGPLPTPVTAFAVRHFHASAGVMVTASHNPPRDNGYKVFLGDADAGSQIIPPADAEIAEAIRAVAATESAQDLPRSRGYEHADNSVIAAYIAETAAAVRAGGNHDSERSGSLTVAYTAMHGVGSPVAQKVFAAAGLPEVVVTPEQDRPDGAFPTVTFPNPEEPGALDLAFRTARECSADLVVAHDPDADRLAIALPDPDSDNGYRALTGNQLGLLLGARMAERHHRTADPNDAPPALACTIVSSPGLRAIAEYYGYNYSETLSGFKWVSRVPNLIFGFEEALGYLVHPQIVHDKDGISASAEVIAFARELRASGRTLWDALTDVYETFGYFTSSQITVRLENPAAVDVLADRLRQNPPRVLGGVSVTRVMDLLVPGNAEIPANVLRYDLADGSRLMIRPSGTEPKLKLYLDTSSTTGDAQQRQREAESALASLADATQELLQAHRES
jgi:phosphomannomutase